MNGFFAFISRMKHINRWGLMRNWRYESLFEHSFETAYIAGALANIENTMFGGSYNAERVTTRAMYHDCAEIITGDMPTPVKYGSGDIKTAYDSAERTALDTLILSLPEPLRPVYRGYTKSGDDRLLIKAADKLSALIKCMDEQNAGNRDFDSAEKSIRAWLSACELKSVKYFMDRLLPAYSLTLDELMENEDV